MDPDTATTTEFEPLRSYLTEVANELYTTERNAKSDTLETAQDASLPDRQLNQRPNSLTKNYNELETKMREVSDQKTKWRNESTGKKELNDKRRKSPNPNKHGPPVLPRNPPGQNIFSFPAVAPVDEQPPLPPRSPRSPPIPPRVPIIPRRGLCPDGLAPPVPPRPHRGNSSSHIYEIEGTSIY